MNVVLLLGNSGDSGGAIYNGLIRLDNGGPDSETRRRPEQALRGEAHGNGVTAAALKSVFHKKAPF
ncbi:MAG: hypothetical protein JWL59_1583 [Chthoniobacteraceae bacterium]|nr:hypothetical protein [Chthoniobacteraceae bacterium]